MNVVPGLLYGRFLLPLLATGALAFTFSSQSAKGALLVDGNSIVNINPASSSGLSDWVVDGTDHMNYQWFFYRVGALGGEATIDTISAPVVSQPTASILDITYSTAQFELQVIYSLLGGGPGSGSSDL